MAKKQTRRSISVSRTTYERLKAFCEANNISMSQFVETRVGDFLGEGQAPSITSVVPTTPRPTLPAQPAQPRPAIVPQPVKQESRPVTTMMHQPAAAPQQLPMTSAAARFAVEPPPPVIKQKQQE